MNAGSWTQLNWAALKYMHIQAHASDLYQLPQFTPCVMSHTHPHLLLQFSIRFQITLLPSLHNNSWAATLLMPTSTSKLQVFFKVKCHIYHSHHVFLSHLTCAKLCYIYQVPIFIWNMSLMMLWVLGPWLIFLISPALCFYVFKCNCACCGGF